MSRPISRRLPAAGECPHCRKPLGTDDAIWPCHECHLVQHAACVERNEGCYGCLVEFVPEEQVRRAAG